MSTGCHWVWLGCERRVHKMCNYTKLLRIWNHIDDRVRRQVEKFLGQAVLTCKIVKPDVAAVVAIPTCVPAAILEEFYYSVLVKPVGKQLVSGG